MGTEPRPDLSVDSALHTIAGFPWEEWLPREEAVLCFIKESDRLLLILKKRGLGAGKINAPGGRIEDGETPVEAAIRETEEEILVRPLNLELRGELSFVFTDGYSLRVYVFLADGFEGTPGATEEADPFWCPLNEIPFDRMWEDDRHWLPKVLSGEHPIGRFIFDGDTMLDMEIGQGPRR
jgi:8-oxo-dGTP diphosphatase